MVLLKLQILHLSEKSSSETKKEIDFDLNHNIDSLKQLALQEKEIATTDTKERLKCNIVFRGITLDCSRTLISYGFKNGNTVQAIVKKAPIEVIAETVKENELREIFIGLQKLIRLGHTTKFVEMVTSKPKLDKLIEASPALGRDLLAYSLIQDVALLSSLLPERSNVLETLKLHPCLVPATREVLRSIMEETKNQPGPSSTGVTPNRPGNSTPVRLGAQQQQLRIRPYGGPTHMSQEDFSVDQNMDVDSEDDQDAEDDNRPGGSTIHSSQLSSAIAQAGVNLLSPQNARRQNTSQGISSDFFRSALASATSNPTGAPSSISPSLTNPPSSEANNRWREQLLTIREMGVTDESIALQALDATNGNVEEALNIIFG